MRTGLRRGAAVLVLVAGTAGAPGSTRPVADPRMAVAAGATPSGPAASRAAHSDTTNELPGYPQPRASYGSFRAACDSLEAIIRRALGDLAHSAEFVHGPVSFRYLDHVTLNRATTGQYFWWMSARDTDATVPGLRITSDVIDPHALDSTLVLAGWDNAQYDADGPNGSMYGRVCGEALAVVVSTWDDAGDDTTLTNFNVQVTCVPRSQAHPLQRLARD